MFNVQPYLLFAMRYTFLLTDAHIIPHANWIAYTLFMDKMIYFAMPSQKLNLEKIDSRKLCFIPYLTGNYK